MARSRRQPLDFRKEEVTYIMDRWRAADSCSLVGVGSVGKSNLLQHLADPETQSAYMNFNDEGSFKSIIIDPAMLGPLPTSGPDMEQVRCWAGYELMMHRLFMAFYPFEILGREDGQRFYDAYQALQDGTNPLYAYMGLRYFELGLDFFMRRGVRIVFMFDEFEDMLKHMPVKFFQTLRGLRDANKRQLSYLTFTRAPLPALIDRYEISAMEVEPFVELFTDSTVYVGPYNDADAYRMVENLMGRNERHYPDTVIEFLLWATGRYAGLIRSGFRLLDALAPVDRLQMMNHEALRDLAMRRAIRDECQTLWSSLTSVEQGILLKVARRVEVTRNEANDRALTMLIQKRLLQTEQPSNTLVIEPPVFRVYVESNPVTKG